MHFGDGMAPRRGRNAAEDIKAIRGDPINVGREPSRTRGPTRVSVAVYGNNGPPIFRRDALENALPPAVYSGLQIETRSGKGVDFRIPCTPIASEIADVSFPYSAEPSIVIYNRRTGHILKNLRWMKFLLLLVYGFLLKARPRPR